MYRITNFLLLMFVLLTRISYAQVFRPENESAKEAKEVIKRINTISEITTFINSTTPSIKEQAIKRLGEIGSEKAGDILSNIYDNESPGNDDVDQGYGFKELVTFALGKTKSEIARTKLIKELNNFIDKGQTKSTGDYIQYGPTTYRMLDAIIKALGNYSDISTKDRLKTIMDNQRNPGGPELSSLAYQSYLEISMNMEGIHSLNKRCNYLINQLTGRGIGGATWIEIPHLGVNQGLLSSEGLENDAIVNLLIRYGKPILPEIKAAIQSTDLQLKDKIDALHEIQSHIEASIYERY